MTSKRLRVLRPLLLGFVLAGVVWAVWRLDLPHHLSVAEMRALVDSQAPYGPLVFMAIVVAGLFTRVPLVATMLIAVGALLFGKIPAFAYGWLAALVGTTAIFVLVRSVARDYVQRALQARTERLRALDDRLARNGFLTVLALRLVLGLAPLLNWGLGLSCGTFAKRYLRRRARIATSSHRRNHARLPHVQRGNFCAAPRGTVSCESREARCVLDTAITFVYSSPTLRQCSRRETTAGGAPLSKIHCGRGLRRHAAPAI